MMTRFTLGLVAVVLLSLTFACGGEEAPTLESYFGDLEQAAQNHDDSMMELQATRDAGLESADSDDARIETFTQFMTDWRSEQEDFATKLSELNATPEAARLQIAVESVAEDLLTAIDQALPALESVDTYDEAAELTSSPLFTVAVDAYRITCGQLEDLAASNDITVDLRCGG